MTTVTPPLPTPPPATPGGQAAVVTVPSPPPALARLAVGQALQATVMSRLAKDLFQVQTPLGTFSVQSALTLPQGSALVLQLQAQTPLLQFQVKSLDGAPPGRTQKDGKAAPASSQGAASRSSRASAAPASPSAGQSLPKLVPGSTLQAVLMRPLSQAVVSPAHPLSGVAATRGNETAPTAPADAAPKTGKPIPQTAAKSPASHPGKPTQAAAPTGQGPRLSAGPALPAGGYLPTGSRLSVKIIQVELPNPAAASSQTTPTGAAAASSGLTPGTRVGGLVTGSTPSGHPIVQTRAGVFALTTDTVVPRGSAVTLEVLSKPSAPAAKPDAAPPLPQSLFSSRQWPALEQAVQALQEANPALARQVLAATVLQPNAGLTAGIIFFLSALKAGDVRAWTGEAPIRLLERIRPNLATRIKDDFTTLARLADEPAANDWRVALIPLDTGAEIQQIRLLLRRHADEEEDGEEGKSDTRFVVDVELSALGRLQLDGLVRNKGKSLDLILRTEHPLPDSMRDDIRTLFAEAAELTGLTGGVGFQAAPPGFIDIPDPTAVNDFGLVV